MKKFTKFCLITALVLAVVGGALFLSGLVMGATWEGVATAAENGINWIPFKSWMRYDNDYEFTESLDIGIRSLGLFYKPHAVLLSVSVLPKHFPFGEWYTGCIF